MAGQLGVRLTRRPRSRFETCGTSKTFAMPVYVIAGAEDLVTVPEVAKAWFDTLVAPRKEFILLPLTDHDPNVAMIDAEYEVLKNRIGTVANWPAAAYLLVGTGFFRPAENISSAVEPTCAVS